MKKISVVLCFLMLLGFGGCQLWEPPEPAMDTFIRIYWLPGDFQAVDVVQLDQGGYLLLGTRRVQARNGQELVLLRTDEMGNLLDSIVSVEVEGADFLVGYGLFPKQFGGYWVYGASRDFSGDWDILLVSLNSNGTSSNEIHLIGSQEVDEFGGGMVYLDQGRIMFAGMCVDCHDSLPGDQQLAIIEVGADFQIRDQFNWGGMGFDSLGAIFRSSDGFVLYGTSSSMGRWTKIQNPFIMSLDSSFENGQGADHIPFLKDGGRFIPIQDGFAGINFIDDGNDDSDKKSSRILKFSDRGKYISKSALRVGYIGRDLIQMSSGRLLVAGGKYQTDQGRLREEMVYYDPEDWAIESVFPSDGDSRLKRFCRNCEEDGGVVLIGEVEIGGNTKLSLVRWDCVD